MSLQLFTRSLLVCPSRDRADCISLPFCSWVVHVIYSGWWYVCRPDLHHFWVKALRPSAQFCDILLCCAAFRHCGSRYQDWFCQHGSLMTPASQGTQSGWNQRFVVLSHWSFGVLLLIYNLSCCGRHQQFKFFMSTRTKQLINTLNVNGAEFSDEWMVSC